MKSEHAEAMVRSEIASAAIAPRIWRALTLCGRLSRRTAIVAWAAIAVGIGLVVGWNWLVAAGLSSVVLAILPCAAMCAAGLCMGRSGGKCADPSSKPMPSQDES